MLFLNVDLCRLQFVLDAVHFVTTKVRDFGLMPVTSGGG